MTTKVLELESVNFGLAAAMMKLTTSNLLQRELSEHALRGGTWRKVLISMLVDVAGANDTSQR